jgi:hypothetical protein
MAYDETLAGRVRRLLKGKNGLTEKKMFGGVGFLINGNMCCGILKQDLILRLGREAAEVALREKHVRVFDITGKAMTGWVMVGPAGHRQDGALREWLRQAAAFAGQLPKQG